MNMHHTSSASGKIVAGFIIIAVGVIFFLRQMGYLFPQWLFTWPMILIVVGLINGAKMGFRDFGWLILVGLGIAFQLDKMYPVFHLIRYVWPLLIIGSGLFMILKRNQTCPDRAERRLRRQKRRGRFMQQMPTTPELAPFTTQEAPVFTQPQDYTVYSSATAEPLTDNNSEFVEITAVLGGNKRHIISKNVRGAEVIALMGGVELNFAQADIHGRVIFDITLLMGGCKLIVPANWLIKSEITSVIGIIEDKRQVMPATNEANPKILVLKGFAVMGGIEINSYS
ncbi:hypothetical protein HUW51_17520 [Adhaeribacter swui]|uniref:LiaF transmembrane domain-containing protein n=1 Tax=Adhaeribacter swui TaxID=2086471 RepID=A0A7G7GBA1_9BACT|nr:DUF5668 domain-containing protein [Adhaeribacter swui]QNF34435.1 hypothetical protein HUW51_17520 [Adhaeribacter swui]